MEHFQEPSKPGTMNPNGFLLKLQANIWLVRYLPGNPVGNVGFADTQLQHVYLIRYFSTYPLFLHAPLFKRAKKGIQIYHKIPIFLL